MVADAGTGMLPANAMTFEQELRVYEEHRKRWIDLGLAGKFAVIKGDRALDPVPDLETAYAAGTKAFGEGFFIRRIVKTDEAQIINRASWAPR